MAEWITSEQHEAGMNAVLTAARKKAKRGGLHQLSDHAAIGYPIRVLFRHALY